MKEVQILRIKIRVELRSVGSKIARAYSTFMRPPFDNRLGEDVTFERGPIVIDDLKSINEADSAELAERMEEMKEVEKLLDKIINARLT